MSPLEHDLDTIQPGYWDALMASPSALREEAERRIDAAKHNLANQVVDDMLGIPSNSDDGLRSMLVNWSEFWAVDHNDAEWVAEPVLAAKRSTALFAPGGTGKSLLSLFIASSLATGRDPFSGRKAEPIRVLYLDYEMTDADLAERLESMGYGPNSNLTRLNYALLPSLPGLDTPEGGKAVVRLAAICDASLVVIDTFGRAVHGDENDADTVRAWYRWTGLHLKHDGRAFLRVDHAGKDLAKGQRGTSAKNDDVDVVWQMTAREGGAYSLVAKKRRMGWVPERVDLMMTETDKLRFGLLDDNSYPVGTVEVARNLDALGLDLTVSYRAAGKALSDAGKGARSAVVRAAIKYRKVRSPTFHLVGDTSPEWGNSSASQNPGRTPSETDWDASLDAAAEERINALVEESGRRAGRSGTH